MKTEETAKSPALIYKRLAEYARSSIPEEKLFSNLDIIMDFHWFFLHSKESKKNFNTKRHIGKWKYDARSVENLFLIAEAILPLVASGDFPVAKFTNIANVFSGEKLIVVYCFDFGLTPMETGSLFREVAGEGVYWGSERFCPEGKGSHGM